MKKFYFKLLFAVLMMCNLQLAAQMVSFEANYDQNQCGPVEVFLNNSSDLYPYVGIENYKWFINDSLISTLQYPDPLILNGGWYDIRLEAYDSLFNQLSSYWQQIYIKGFSGKFYTFPELEATTNQPITFSTYDNMNWVVWKFHNGTVLNYNHAQFIYPTEGVYPVKMTISGECGMNTVTQFITIANTAKPYTHIELSNWDVCPNDEFILKASPAFKKMNG